MVIEKRERIQPSIPGFRVAELKMPHPVTGARFWVEWEVEKEVEEYVKAWWTFGLFFRKKRTIVKVWEIFYDPASTEANSGYQTMAEAMYVVERYKLNMVPRYHYA